MVLEKLRLKIANTKWPTSIGWEGGGTAIFSELKIADFPGFPGTLCGIPKL